LGFENKVDKVNKTLSKHETDQCSGHFNWLQNNFPEYDRLLYIVGDLETYNELASLPANLYYISVAEIKKNSEHLPEIYAKRLFPEQIDSSLDSKHLRVNEIFSKNKVSTLKKVKFG
jgi:hypothetical protein